MKQNMSNCNNNIIFLALDNDNCWGIDESMPKSACASRLKISLLIREFARAKENITIESEIEEECGMIVDMSKSTIK